MLLHLLAHVSELDYGILCLLLVNASVSLHLLGVSVLLPLFCLCDSLIGLRRHAHLERIISNYYKL